MDNETKQPHTVGCLHHRPSYKKAKENSNGYIKGNKNPNPKLFVSKTYCVVKSVLTNKMTMAVLSLLQAFCFLKCPPFVDKKVTVRNMPSNYTKKGLMRSLQLHSDLWILGLSK
jgi:hypothetical protein